jgi:arylsulfatase A-like enzyme
LLIIPDHGRELERPGGPGFVHHSDFYTHTGADEGCRREFLLALGPEFLPGQVIRERVSHLDVAPTIARLFGCELPDAPGRSLVG